MDRFTSTGLRKLTLTERRAKDKEVHRRVDEIAGVWGSVKPDMWTYFRYEIANLCREVQQSRSNEVPHDGQPRK